MFDMKHLWDWFFVFFFLAYLSIAQVSLYHGAASIVHRPTSVNFWHFELLLKNRWRNLLQTCRKCSIWGPDQVLFLFKSIWNPISPPRPLIGWHILKFFSRTAKGIYYKLATNINYEVPTKCCYFSSRSKIQYGHPGLWLADTYWTSSQELLKGSTPNLPQMFLLRSRPSVVTF